MRRIPSPPRPFCLLVALALVLAGGEALARGSAKKKGSSQSTSSSASGSKRHPTEVHLKGEEASDSGNTTSASSAPPSRGPARIDFDDRLIQGQTNKSGAVYLYERKELKTRSMVKKRESFRDEIVGSVYDG